MRKFDPVERDLCNRSLGKAGEEFVVDVERRQLTGADRPDLARKVRWVAAEDGDGAGYDVLSFDATGRERLLEVKTTNGSARTPYFLTRNERDLAAGALCRLAYLPGSSIRQGTSRFYYCATPGKRGQSQPGDVARVLLKISTLIGADIR